MSVNHFEVGVAYVSLSHNEAGVVCVFFSLSEGDVDFSVIVNYLRTCVLCVCGLVCLSITGKW